MNWDAIGAIGEVGGAIAVLGSREADIEPTPCFSTR